MFQTPSGVFPAAKLVSVDTASYYIHVNDDSDCSNKYNDHHYYHHHTTTTYNHQKQQQFRDRVVSNTDIQE